MGRATQAVLSEDVKSACTSVPATARPGLQHPHHQAARQHSTHTTNGRSQIHQDSTLTLLVRRALHMRSFTKNIIHMQTACTTAAAIGKLPPGQQRLFESHHQLHTYSTHPERPTATECMQQCNETVYMLGHKGHKKNVQARRPTQTSTD
jgi:hypothetical protein